MTNYREILRLSNLGIAKMDIAARCGCSRNTVTNVLQRAAACRISWPLSYAISGACVEDIEYHPDRRLDKGQIIRLATCNYIQEYHNVLPGISQCTHSRRNRQR